MLLAIRFPLRPVYPRDTWTVSNWVNEYARKTEHMQASASVIALITSGEYDVKSDMMMLLTLGCCWVSFSGRRLKEMIEVIVGDKQHCKRTSEPRKPVELVRTIFMAVVIVN